MYSCLQCLCTRQATGLPTALLFLTLNMTLQRARERLAATHYIIHFEGSIIATKEMFRSPPAEWGTKSGSKPQSLQSRVKRGDHPAMQTVNSLCFAVAQQDPSSVMCPLLQISTWPTSSRDRHHIAGN